MGLEAIQELLVQVLNVSLMFSVGLEVDRRGVRRALTRTGLLGGVLLFNFLLVPLVAWAHVRLLELTPAIAAGVMLSAVCPGGGTGTLLTRVGRGSLELSIVLLGLLTALAVPILPLLTRAEIFTFGGAPLELGPLLRTLILFQLAPLLIGALVSARSSEHAARLDRLARPLSNAVFAILVVGLLVTRGHLALRAGWQGLGAMAIVVVLSVLLPAALAVPWRERAALSLTSGVRNLSLALLLATTFFDDETTIAVLTYGLVMYLVSIPWAFWLRRRTGVVVQQPATSTGSSG